MLVTGSAKSYRTCHCIPCKAVTRISGVAWATLAARLASTANSKQGFMLSVSPAANTCGKPSSCGIGAEPAGYPSVTLILIRNANLYAPQPLGIRHLLIGGGRILWIGEEAFDL